MVPSKEIIYPELSQVVMNVLFEVHKQLGPGFTEDIYERAVIQEFGFRGLRVEQQKTIAVHYKGVPVGTYRLDMVIEDCIVLELKAVTVLNDLFKQQLLSYLRAGHYRLGVLVNFGGSRLEYTRIAN